MKRRTARVLGWAVAIALTLAFWVAAAAVAFPMFLALFRLVETGHG